MKNQSKNLGSVIQKIMGKGMEPKKGYNDKKYKDNYDTIDWSKTREVQQTRKDNSQNN